jgi:3-methyladenine DNA glycosylase AlkD
VRELAVAGFKSIEERVSKVQHGFSQMRDEASKIVGSSSVAQSLRTAEQLYASEKYQVRMVAVFVMGYIASRSEKAVGFLRNKVSRDKAWQVQEILAQSFNEYCRSVGYEKALPTIQGWLQDPNANSRRAVTEGLRIWNQKDYFRDHPDVAIRFLAMLKDDESEYVRKSVGNALRDISRKEKNLIRKELETWDLANPKIRFTYELARKFI